SNSANFNDTPTGQSFEDVPPGSTFYIYIERMTSRGVMSGYSCGGVGEPCNPPANRPYFRPNANATRGQISKIISNAANLDESHVSQTFQDVAPDSPFYIYIERLASRGIMGGYSCGAVPQEPCVAPGNLPYFRPGNTATRGQVAKIDTNTFYPSCATAKPSR
nr:S-layer homology domain-containing protein [Chloroflexota bacterium]